MRRLQAKQILSNVARIPCNRFCFLAGSGISADSGLPTAWQFNTELARVLCSNEVQRKLLTELLVTGVAASLKSSGSSIQQVRFERLLYILRTTIDPQLSVLALLERSWEPNPLHFLLVYALEAGAKIFTTNVDSLLEVAWLSKYDVSRRPLQTVFAETHNETPRIKAAETFKKWKPIPSQPVLFKLHGSLRSMNWFVQRYRESENPLQETINLTLDRLANPKTVWGLDKHKEATLLRQSAGKFLIVLGYSGLDDFDVVPSLRRMLRRLKGILWILHSNESRPVIPPDGRVPEILRSLREEAGRYGIPCWVVAGNTRRLLSTVLKRTEHVRPPREIEPFTASSFLSLPNYSLIGSGERSLVVASIYAAAGLTQEARRYFTSTTEEAGRIMPREELVALGHEGLGRLAWLHRDAKDARVHFQRSARLWHVLKNDRGEARILANLASVQMSDGNYLMARKFYRASLTKYRRLGDTMGIALTMGNLGVLFGRQGHFRKAMNYLEGAYRLDRSARNLDGMARHLGNMGTVNLYQNRFAIAAQTFMRVEKLNRLIGRRDGVAIALVNRATAYGHYKSSRRLGDATALVEEAMQINIDLDRPEGVMECLMVRAELEVRLGNLDAALEFCRRAIELGKKHPDDTLAETWELLATIYAGKKETVKQKRALHNSQVIFARLGNATAVRRVRKKLLHAERN